MSLIDSILNKLLPHPCLVCGQEGALLCSSCADLLPAANIDHPATNLDNIQAYTYYRGAAKDLIWSLKSGGAQAAASSMACLMAKLVPAGVNYMIVPVPTATARARQRGYDQAKLIARALSRQTGLPYADCLARHGRAHQVGASREQRLRQLSGSLRVKSRRVRIKNKNVILVDDVTTTGATLEMAAAVLKRADAAYVEALTFAYAQ